METYYSDIARRWVLSLHYVITQPFWMQVFRLMNVQLISTDKTSPYVMLRGIPSSDLMDSLRELVQQARLRNHMIEIS
jgi:hypothetical protein